jgi:hypothetical protein
MTSVRNVSTPGLDRVLDVLEVLVVVSIFFFGTFDTWISTGEAGAPTYLLSVLLVAVGLTLGLVANFIDTRPEPSARRMRVRKPYLAEVFFWGYSSLMFAGIFFDVGITDIPWVLITASSLVTAMGLVRLLYAKGSAVW